MKVVAMDILFSRDRTAEDLLADVASIDLPDHSRGQLTRAFPIHRDWLIRVFRQSVGMRRTLQGVTVP